ncbi:hypothetical protein BH11ARM1_BH11ARM1_16600 [soil metagenome]
MIGLVNRKLRWLLVIPALIVGVPAGLYLTRDFQAHRRLDEQIRLARMDGISMSAAEIAKLVPTARPEENAGLFYKKLKYKAPSDFSQVTKMASFDRSAKAQLARKKILEDARADLALLDAGTKLPHCWFDRDWNLGAAVLFPELRALRTGSKLLGLRGSLAAQAGDHRAALGDADRIFKISDHLQEEGSQLGDMISITLYRTGLDQLSKWSFAYPSEPTYRAALAARLGKFKARSLKRQHADDLWILLNTLDQSTTREGLAEVGLKPEDAPPLDRIMPLFLNRTDAKATIIRNYRLIWEQLGQPKPNEKVIGDAKTEMLKSSFAYPSGINIYSKLVGGEGGTFEYMDRDMQHVAFAGQMKFVAVSRALAGGKMAKSIKTSDLIGPNGKPISYSFDGNTIKITTHRDDGDSTYKLPP